LLSLLSLSLLLLACGLDLRLLLDGGCCSCDWLRFTLVHGVPDHLYTLVIVLLLLNDLGLLWLWIDTVLAQNLLLSLESSVVSSLPGLCGLHGFVLDFWNFGADEGDNVDVCGLSCLA
ncbi:hypothetical protein KCU65_g269, partial [Aureobasidium melanogenum]